MSFPRPFVPPCVHCAPPLVPRRLFVNLRRPFQLLHARERIFPLRYKVKTARHFFFSLSLPALHFIYSSSPTPPAQLCAAYRERCQRQMSRQPFPRFMVPGDLQFNLLAASFSDRGPRFGFPLYRRRDIRAHEHLLPEPENYTC